MRKFIQFVYNDIKTDIEFIFKVLHKISKGEKILNPAYKARLKSEWHEYKKDGIVLQLIKDNWLNFFVWAAFFMVGMWFAQQDCADMCNTYIAENYLPDGYWDNGIYIIYPILNNDTEVISDNWIGFNITNTG